MVVCDDVMVVVAAVNEKREDVSIMKSFAASMPIAVTLFSCIGLLCCALLCSAVLCCALLCAA